MGAKIVDVLNADSSNRHLASSSVDERVCQTGSEKISQCISEIVATSKSQLPTICIFPLTIISARAPEYARLLSQLTVDS